MVVVIQYQWMAGTQLLQPACGAVKFLITPPLLPGME